MLYLDYKRCERIIKQNSHTFYKAFSRLPKEKSRAIYVVYAFCRMADDLVDEASDMDGIIKLENELKAFERGRPVNTFLWRALRDVFGKYSMDTRPFYEMIEGQKMDFEIKRYQTLKVLEKYCYHVAGTVGLMILPILAPDSYKNLKQCAIHLGLAMQITNILRDIGEDHQRGRVYIPQEMLRLYGYSEEMLDSNTINPEFVQLWEALANIAEENYDKAQEFYKYFPEDSRISVEGAALFYREILNSCRAANYNVFTKRNYVETKRKLELINQIKSSSGSIPRPM